MAKKIKYNGELIFALPCEPESLGCDKCMFSTHDGCSVSGDMDKGDLPDCSDTPGSDTSLGYRVYFTRDNTRGNS